MRGVLAWGSYLPRYRLDRAEIPGVAGTGGGTGTRAVASYDEDTTTLAVAAARRAVRSSPVHPAAVWLATTTPAYLDKTNATAVHAALRLDRQAAAFDAVGSVRSTMAALRAAVDGTAPTLVIGSDLRTGRPGSADEAAGADAAAAVVIGGDGDGEVLAEPVAIASVTDEFLDRWRAPADPASKTWEERFGEGKYLPLAAEALKLALESAGVGADDVDHLVVAGLHDRACAGAARASGVPEAAWGDRLSAGIGNPGAAQPLLLLAAALEQARPDQTVVLLTLSDGADAVVWRTTSALARYRGGPTVAAQQAAGHPVGYGRYLAWRGWLPVEPPRRPEPARPSGAAAGRRTAWKFGLAGPEGVLADQRGTIATYTVDRLAYSPSPPVVFAVVDFDDGERLPVELTDVDAREVRIGMRVEMTFRRLFTADGIANYFWKACPAGDSA